MDEVANGNTNEKIGSGAQGSQGLSETNLSNRARNINSFKRSLATEEDDEEATLSKGKSTSFDVSNKMNIQNLKLTKTSMISIITISFYISKTRCSCYQ